MIINKKTLFISFLLSTHTAIDVSAGGGFSSFRNGPDGLDSDGAGSCNSFQSAALDNKLYKNMLELLCNDQFPAQGAVVESLESDELLSYIQAVAPVAPRDCLNRLRAIYQRMLQPFALRESVDLVSVNEANLDQVLSGGIKQSELNLKFDNKETFKKFCEAKNAKQYLTRLKLDFADGVINNFEEQDWKDLAKLRNLKELDLSALLKHLSDARQDHFIVVQNILSGIEKLPKLTTLSLAKLMCNGTNLNKELESKISKLTRLKHLDLSEMLIAGQGKFELKEIGNLGGLTSLDLTKSGITADSIADAFSKHTMHNDMHKNLKNLWLGSSNLRPNSRFITELRKLQELRQLDMHDVKFTKITSLNGSKPSLGSALSNMTKLQKLTLNNCGLDSIESIQELAASLSKMKYLRSLNLGNMNFVEVSPSLGSNNLPLGNISVNSKKGSSLILDAIKEHKHLEELDLSEIDTSGNWTDSFLKWLQSTTSKDSLRSLNLHGNKVRDPHFLQTSKLLSTFVKLESLDISDFDVQPETVKNSQVYSEPRLSPLVGYLPHGLRSLNLGNNSYVRDENLVGLLDAIKTHHPDLDDLNLTHNSLSPAGMAYLLTVLDENRLSRVNLQLDSKEPSEMKRDLLGRLELNDWISLLPLLKEKANSLLGVRKSQKEELNAAFLIFQSNMKRMHNGALLNDGMPLTDGQSSKLRDLKKLLGSS